MALCFGTLIEEEYILSSRGTLLAVINFSNSEAIKVWTYSVLERQEY